MSDDVLLLVDRCLAGDQTAMLAFVEHFQGQVFGLCFRMLQHRQDAEDMTQESFIRALRSLAHWDRSREIVPWLMAIAGNRCRTLLAVRGRRPMATALVEQVADENDDDPARHLGEEVQRVLSKIRAEYRQAFLLFHEHELPYAEIASAMGVPLGTIKTWVHRARREIIDELQKREVLAEVPHAVRRI